MKKLTPSQNRGDAFSLVEILLALGLVGVAVIALLALFPVAVKGDKENAEETRATLIASGMMESLTANSNSDALLLAIGMSNGLPIWQRLPRKTMSNISVAYNNSCEPLRTLSEADGDMPIPEQAAVAVASLGVFSNSALPGTLSVEIAVSSPASAPASARTTRRFDELITVP